MSLQLERPLASVDVETTGTNYERDRVIQVGIVLMMPDGARHEKEMLIDPGVPIPREATAKHGITDEMVRGQPTFAQRAQNLADGFSRVDVTGFNVVGFDVPILRAEFKRAGVECKFGKVVDVQDLYRRYHPRTLQDAAREYLGMYDETGAHTGARDARVALNVLVAQLERHTELPRTVDGLHQEFYERLRPGQIDSSNKFSWRHGEPIVNFGKKWNGVPMRQVDRGYFQWMLNAEFPEDAKRVAREALAGRFPGDPEQATIGAQEEEEPPL